ncbi:hypothetical protein ACWEV9_35940, partial [Streptomyces albogriseolus]
VMPHDRPAAPMAPRGFRRPLRDVRRPTGPALLFAGFAAVLPRPEGLVVLVTVCGALIPLTGAATTPPWS